MVFAASLVAVMLLGGHASSKAGNSNEPATTPPGQWMVVRINFQSSAQIPGRLFRIDSGESTKTLVGSLELVDCLPIVMQRDS